MRVRLQRPLGPLQWAIAASVAAHAVLLTLRFAPADALHRVFEDSPLAVVLVNRSTADAPTHPQELAQVNLDGGGDAARGMAATPLPPMEQTAPGDALQDESRMLADAQQQERELITQVRSQIVQLQQIATHAAQPAAARALEERRRRLLEILGAIERRVAQDNAGPRRRFVGPSTRSRPYAIYYDHMRQCIEHQGTVDFPERAGRKLYGKLIMAITVDAQGHVLQTQVVRGSGDAELDRRSRAIVLAAQPFGNFTPGMRRDADQIVIVAGFDFTRDAGLETHLQGQTGL